MTDMMSLDRFELNVSLNMPRPFKKYPRDMSKTIGLATDLFLGGKTGFFALAAWSELFISLMGFYGSGAVLVNKVFGKTVFPMGKSIL